MKHFWVILLLLAACLSNAETKSVEDLLRENLGCVKDTEYEVDEEGDTLVYGRAYYDIKNGYASSYDGGSPPCGCGCSAQVGLFKDAKGEYTIITSDYSDCSGLLSLSVVNKDILDIMPKGFCIDWFLGHEKPDLGDFSFQISFNIPQEGTDMYVSLSPLPLYSLKNEIAGMTFVGYGYDHNSDEKTDVAFALQYLNQFVSEEAMESISMTEFDQISQKDMEILMSSDIRVREFEKLKKGANVINDIRYFYDIYMEIEHSDMLLSWNRKTARFDLKEKGPKVERVSFKKFIETVSISSLGC